MIAASRRRAGAAIVTFAAALLVIAPAAGAKIFWANQASSPNVASIGSANVDGTDVNQYLVVLPSTEDASAVATDGRYVYWAGRPGAGRPGTIGRATVDGKAPNPKLISGIKFSYGQIAVDSGHIYWTQQDDSGPGIGRANLDGSNVEPRWIPLPGIPRGLAIDRDHLYWTWQHSRQGPVDIARANINGTDVQDSFIQTGSGGPFSPFFIAVDSAHIYTLGFGGGALLRADLDGRHVNNHVADIPSTCGIAVDASHIYWGTLGKRGSAVGRANLDGTGIDPSFITGGRLPCGVAVSPAGLGRKQIATLRLSPAHRSSPPTSGGTSVVTVECVGPAGKRCRGSVRLLPRGARARRLVGEQPIAEQSVSLRTGAKAKLRLKLSRRAREVVRSQPLAVTIELDWNGRSTRTPATLFDRS